MVFCASNGGLVSVLRQCVVFLLLYTLSTSVKVSAGLKGEEFTKKQGGEKDRIRWLFMATATYYAF